MEIENVANAFSYAAPYFTQPEKHMLGDATTLTHRLADLLYPHSSKMLRLDDTMLTR